MDAQTNSFQGSFSHRWKVKVGEEVCRYLLSGCILGLEGGGLGGLLCFFSSSNQSKPGQGTVE